MSDWASQHGVADIERKVGMGAPLSAAEMNLLQQYTSIAPSGWVPDLVPGNQADIWSGHRESFVDVVQDREAVDSSFGGQVSQAFHALTNIRADVILNPLKYGDAFGLTYGPLSGHAPGQLTDAGIDVQQVANPGVERSTLETANRVAPWVAAAIATFGGSSVADVSIADEGVYGVSGIESAEAPALDFAENTGIDASTGEWAGESANAGAYTYGPSSPSFVEGLKTASNVLGIATTLKSLFSSRPESNAKQADVGVYSAPWKTPGSSRDGSPFNSANVGAALIFVAVVVIGFILIRR